ncbi:MAG: dTDP-4-dehydrorhamnose reductase [Planctomycetes bacterium]|jgi:dTDP-4-dehydrorhamnose reductase|nr:dTDP-4-dehydrorhamnose reductase [Planctomycetota bacterium]
MGKQTVALLGGKGMLATATAAACRRQGFEVRLYDLPAFDVTNPDHVEPVVKTADAIINCAAYTDVDGAESQSALARRVNGEAVGRLGQLARTQGKWLLHISTDFVFDGELDRPYVETDRPHPINEYGRSKLAGELLLRESGSTHCLIRLEWTYGPHGRNFITKLVERARTSRTLNVVNDQVGSPTATAEVAQVLCTLLGQRAEGLFHFASAGYVSRYDLAAFVFDQLRMDVELKPCRTRDYPEAALRPLNSRFDCRKIQAILPEPIAPWQEPLERFLREL